MDPHLQIAASLCLAAMYPLCPQAVRRVVLLIASYLFYAFINFAFVPILFGVSLISFTGGWAIERWRQSTLPVSVSIVIVLSPLVLYKYWEAWFGEFILPGVPVSSLQFGGYGSVLVPVGLSFYTFQAIGYLVDVKRGTDPAERNFIRFLLFMSFFPQLLAGPIERFRSLSTQLWSAPIPRTEMLAPAVLLIFYGLFLKTVIGDRIGVSVDEVYVAKTLGWRDALMATVGFTIQIFADFAGYSLIAVGTARLFGIELTNNFKQPFFSHNLVEFWQRWHISLTRWIGDYFYRPVGRMMLRYVGHDQRQVAEISTALLVWVIMGLWHGPTLPFVIFGILQAMAMQAIRLSGPDRPALLPRWRIGLGMLCTFGFVSLTFGLIRTPDLESYGNVLTALFTLAPGQAPTVDRTILIIGIVIMITVEAIHRFAAPNKSAPVWQVYSLIGLLFVITILFGYDQARSFVYFRF